MGCNWTTVELCITENLHTDLKFQPYKIQVVQQLKMRDYEQPTTSPDLSSYHFFLRGYLKCRVYSHKLRNLNDLKDAFRQFVLMIRVMDDFKIRIEICIQEDGRHLIEWISSNSIWKYTEYCVFQNLSSFVGAHALKKIKNTYLRMIGPCRDNNQTIQVLWSHDYKGINQLTLG